VERILTVLDVNCLTQDAPAANLLGNSSVVNCGVGLWILPSFINHSCHSNARRTHVGDHAIVHSSRDIKAGEEVTFPYFDVLVPVSKRREAARAWGFQCHCDRCRFEADDVTLKLELMKAEKDLVGGGYMGALVVRLEEKMGKSVGLTPTGVQRLETRSLVARLIPRPDRGRQPTHGCGHPSRCAY
jgi:hypothetical protein